MNQKPVVAGIGELLWDLLPTGKQMGGAPANFAFHAAQCGCESHIISAVGDDADGSELLDRVEKQNLNPSLIQKNRYPTGTVTVSLSQHGQPDYTIHEGVAWDNIAFDSALKNIAGKLNAVCFGSLAQRSSVSATTVQRLLSATNPDCLRVFDINLRQSYYSKEIIETSLQSTDILKLNNDELPVLSAFFKLSGESEDQLNQLLIRYNLKFVVYTLGAKGSIVLSRTAISRLDAPKIEVTDTVGAGDAFTAIFITGLLRGVPFREAHQQAGKVAAYVCTQNGACPVLPFQVF